MQINVTPYMSVTVQNNIQEKKRAQNLSLLLTIVNDSALIIFKKEWLKVDFGSSIHFFLDGGGENH